MRYDNLLRQCVKRTCTMLRNFLYCVTFSVFVDSARILGVFPIPSVSHQYVFRALTLELAKRGHELVVITPDPALPKDRPPDNITEIDVSFSYDQIEQFKQNNDYYKRGVIMDAEMMLNFGMWKEVADYAINQIDSPDVKKLIEDKNQHFDLIIAEAVFNYHLILTEIFKAPTILVSSFHGFTESYEIVGAVARHPIFYPNMFRKNFEPSSLFEKIYESKLEYQFYQIFKEVEVYENQVLKAKYGPHAPTVNELKNNVDFLLINSNQIFCNNRPVPPNVAFVGPLHLKPSKELPADLKSYLDNSKTGVIYVSLGTNVDPLRMDEDFLNAFLDAFETLPFDILWKFNEDAFKRRPKNVKIQKWFPQRDILAHPNIKLFVYQGGLQSTDEAIDVGVPLVTIPMLGDQFYNGHKVQQLGIGVKLDALTLDAATLLAGIKKVLYDDSYRDNMRNFKQIVNDHPQSPMERAVWWVEYVLRHKGARHFRSPGANISWAEYLMADVLLTLALAGITTFFIIIFIVRFILTTFNSNRPPPKSKMS